MWWKSRNKQAREFETKLQAVLADYLERVLTNRRLAVQMVLQNLDDHLHWSFDRESVFHFSVAAKGRPIESGLEQLIEKASKSQRDRVTQSLDETNRSIPILIEELEKAVEAYPQKIRVFRRPSSLVPGVMDRARVQTDHFWMTISRQSETDADLKAIETRFFASGFVREIADWLQTQIVDVYKNLVNRFPTKFWSLVVCRVHTLEADNPRRLQRVFAKWASGKYAGLLVQLQDGDAHPNPSFARGFRLMPASLSFAECDCIQLLKSVEHFIADYRRHQGIATLQSAELD